ncbi:hypothetical protein L6452_16458 [Arctium lappa]|uniref:Uncharacterized protein n=1 Tax=Arctium lappa TaxID=4217 RepID=A0ACB9C0T0_ARCLA|nr:hypothetical protein L6452_16458 [Arctium lappa]
MPRGFLLNGVSSAVYVDLPVTTNSGIRNLMQNISVLEQDKQELMYAKQLGAHKIEELKREIFSDEGTRSELSGLKRVAERLKKSKSEKTNKIVVIEKETNLLLERLDKDAVRLKAGENRFTYWRRKLMVFWRGILISFSDEDIGQKIENNLKVGDRSAMDIDLTG